MFRMVVIESFPIYHMSQQIQSLSQNPNQSLSLSQNRNQHQSLNRSPSRNQYRYPCPSHLFQ